MLPDVNFCIIVKTIILSGVSNESWKEKDDIKVDTSVASE